MFLQDCSDVFLPVLLAALISVVAFGQDSTQPLAGRKLIVGTKSVAPFAMKNDEGAWEGISIDLWREIATALEVDYEFREHTLEDLLAGLRGGSLDVCVAALTVTAERERTIDFTHAFHNSGLGIATVRGHGRGWLGLAQRFASWAFLKVVFALTAILFLAGTLVWLFEKRRNAEQFGGDAPRGLGAAFWWSAVTMTTVGYGDKAPKTIGGRLVALVWMFTSVIIISGFTAAIASSLTVTQLQALVKGPQDLPKVRVGTVAASTSEEYLRRNHMQFRPYEAALDGLDAVVAREIDVFVYDAPVLKYCAVRRFHGSVYVLPGTFERQYYAIGLQEGSPLREPMNRVLVDRINAPQWKDVLYTYLGE
ncbi:MAG: transporter substrate-binding domain-containing protein [Phycisphaerales bacterium]|nr:MAG: transporter substrate-binding domain-containing protein [Phycisphaerales bacterium]